MNADTEPKDNPKKNADTPAARSEHRVVATIGAAAAPENAAMAANLTTKGDLPLTSKELLALAKAEAKTAEKAMDAKELVAEREGYRLVELMLRLGNTFINRDGEWNQEAFNAFLEQNGMKKHGNAKSNWQLVAKICFSKGVRPDRVTKFWQALYALNRSGVHPDNVTGALQAKPDPEANSKAMQHSGLYRYVLLFKEYQKADREQIDETAPASNRYAKMPDDKLRQEALLLLDALKERGLLNINVEKLRAKLSEEKD